MTSSDTSDSEATPCYSIDLDWYQTEQKSFASLVHSRLCQSCRNSETGSTDSDSALLKAIQECCSQKEFITPNLPLREMVFRLFLGNGNSPLELEQIRQKLQEWLDAFNDPRDASTETLRRLVEHDHYYGLRRFPDAEAAQASA